MIATASRVGTGNMAGVATAIVLGGPGAAFWMWLMAVLGAASAFVESTLAQIYKKREGDSFKGGPAYYIERALGARWLGVIFAISLIATFAFGFNGLQAYNIVSAFDVYTADMESTVLPTAIGLILAIASLYIFFAGDVIGKISSVLVPAMAGLYIAVGIFVIITNITRLPGVLALIMRNAFDFRAIFGGFTGSCMVLGIKRGLFSNEAGMGSAPNASASATVSHPAKQGLAQIISVYIDTLLICSTTVFLILLTGDWAESGYSGIPLLQQCVARVIGPIGIHFVTVIVCLFAFTSIIGNYFYAEANILFITKNPTVMTVFRVAAAIMVFIGAGNSLDVAWSLADITMGLEAVVNIIAILLLGKIAFKALEDYEDQMARGLDPVFHESNIGLNDTDVWK
jgi:AGCS family alanine or glycine:cation symporter